MIKNIALLTRNDKASVILWTAIALPIILLILVVTIDLSKTQNAYLDVEAANQSAAYSTAEFINNSESYGKDIPQAEIEKFAFELIKNNTSADQSYATVIPEEFSIIREDDKITVKSCMMVKHSFTSSVGLSKSRKVCSSAEAKLMATEPPLTIVVVKTELNKQQGWYTSIVRVHNPGSKASGPVGITVDMAALPANTVLVNKQQEVSPQILDTKGLGAGEYKDYAIETYVIFRTTPNLKVSVDRTSINKLRHMETEEPAISPIRRFDNIVAPSGGTLLSFPTEPGKAYVIQYSSDEVNWVTSVPEIPPMGGSQTEIFFQDNGPPRTESHPNNTSRPRYYRAFVAKNCVFCSYH